MFSTLICSIIFHQALFMLVGEVLDAHADLFSGRFGGRFKTGVDYD